MFRALNPAAAILLLAALISPLASSASAAPPETPAQLLPYEPKQPTVLQRGLTGLTLTLRWLGRFATIAPYVRDLHESIDELLRLLQDARRAADAQGQLELLLAKVTELEQRLSTSDHNQTEAARLRPLLRRLQGEIEAGRRSRYRPCGENMHRGPKGCIDKREQTEIK